MSSTPRILRPYQVRLVTDVCRASVDVLVEQPTGSGKTMQIVTLVGMNLGRRFAHAVIAAPQEQIEHCFVHRDYEQVGFPPVAAVATPNVSVPNGLIWGARVSELGSVKRVLAYLRQAGPLDHALACTHAALNRLTPERLPANLSGKALFLDEAHHAAAEGLSRIISVWRERGGQLYFFTATPYRGDGRPVALDNMKLSRPSLAEHMAEGFAPGHLESEIVALGRAGDVITPAQFTGEEAPPTSYFDVLIMAICQRWIVDGKPKAIVRVPPMRGGSQRLVGQLIAALRQAGARVLDGTGVRVADKKRFLDALEAEGRRGYGDSGFDVLVGIQRVMEGTDWPLCAAVYCVGMPGSLNTVVQMLGRAMRQKGNDYPAAQRESARMVFFVPCGGGSALADLSIDHSRHALLTCCFLAAHEVGQEWIVLHEVRRGIEAAFGEREDNATAADAENEADEPLAPEVRGEVELTLAAAREEIIANGGLPRLGGVLQLAAQRRPDLPAPALQRIAAEVLASQPGSTGRDSRQAIRDEVAKCLRIDPMVKAAMTEAFAAVLHEFRDATLKESIVLESVGRQVHGVTGGQMQEFAQRLRDAAPRLLSIDQILSWADAYHGRTGQWPKESSGIIDENPDDTWKAIHQALVQGLRGLAGGTTLAKLLAEERGARHHLARPSLTQEQILVWADAHHARTGKWPKQTSGTIIESPSETWKAVHVALTKGGRGLPGGSSLPQLLATERGVDNHLSLPRLTEEGILDWADAHFEKTGKWPIVDGGPVHGASGETWRIIEGALRRGTRGLPGGSSLAKLLNEKRGTRNLGDLSPLTAEIILGWADSHYRRTGEWPKAKSGAVLDARGETWRNINAALLQGLRGLSGDSSLAQLLAQERGVRNSADLTSLTIEQVLGWADAHFSRTGEWPSRTSGPIVETSNETWATINTALIYGTRGLPKGLSLARLFAKERGMRNRMALPDLTIDQILSWADAYQHSCGHWPKASSGRVNDGLSETWSGINTALIRGRRGLPGGSSLANLLKEHRGVRNKQDLPILTLKQILCWADAFNERTGKWPNYECGPIPEATGETWKGVHMALMAGGRGLTGGSSLSSLLKNERGAGHANRRK